MNHSFQNIIDKIIREIKGKKLKISVLSHIDPDGDTIGAGLAFSSVLKKLGHHVTMISPNNIPDFLCWMPGCQDIIVATKNKQKTRTIIEDCDLIFCIDFNHIDRNGMIRDTLRKAKAKKILIDHHLDPEDFTDITFSVIKVSSAAELVCYIMHDPRMNKFMDKEIAECLYAAIMTDTGSFHYAMNSPESFHCVGELVKYNLDQEKIQSLVYHNYSFQRQQLMGYALYKKLKYFPEYNTAYISLTQKELEQFNHKKGDTEGFVNIPLQIKGTVFSALFIEKQDQIKISFRSKGDIKANDFAINHFQGGGHKNAAGGSQYNLSLEETLTKFESLLPEFFGIRK